MSHRRVVPMYKVYTLFATDNLVSPSRNPRSTDVLGDITYK